MFCKFLKVLISEKCQTFRQPEFLSDVQKLRISDIPYIYSELSDHQIFSQIFRNLELQMPRHSRDLSQNFQTTRYFSDVQKPRTTDAQIFQTSISDFQTTRISDHQIFSKVPAQQKLRLVDHYTFQTAI